MARTRRSGSCDRPTQRMTISFSRTRTRLHRPQQFFKSKLESTVRDNGDRHVQLASSARFHGLVLDRGWLAAKDVQTFIGHATLAMTDCTGTHSNRTTISRRSTTWRRPSSDRRYEGGGELRRPYVGGSSCLRYAICRLSSQTSTSCPSTYRFACSVAASSSVASMM
jgi:hypothetical protein